VDQQRREVLSDLLLQWEDEYQRGQDVPAAELAREYPELAAELAERIRGMKATSWLANPLTGSPDVEPEPPLECSARRTLSNRYRLDELIALGGFAEVWRAYDSELQRSVAVKIPKAAQGESADAFMAEARRVARLRHSGIVPVYDVGREGDQCFIVSEFMDGGSLATWLVRKGVDHATVVRWIGQIADALEYAHLNGVIHRDVKPANILINHHEDALLGDFGIAQSANKTGRFDPSLGTLFYMSPEQLEGRPITPVSDVFSLAVVLYEALTGEMPYSSLDPNTIRHEITKGWKKPWPSKIPQRLVPVLTKAMHRNPQQRHNSASHFGADVARAWSEQPRRPQWALWAISLAAIGLIGAAATAGFIAIKRPTAGDQPIGPKVPVGNDTRDDLKQIKRAVDHLTNSIVEKRQQEEDAIKASAYAKAMEAKRLSDEGNYKLALNAIRAAIDLDSSNPRYLHYLGVCYFNMKDYAAALHTFDSAIRIEPNNTTYHLHRAYTLSVMGQQDEARDAFQDAGVTAKSEIPTKLE
jgi:serine/threonine protein kinase